MWNIYNLSASVTAFGPHLSFNMLLIAMLPPTYAPKCADCRRECEDDM